MIKWTGISSGFTFELYKGNIVIVGTPLDWWHHWVSPALVLSVVYVGTKNTALGPSSRITFWSFPLDRQNIPVFTGDEYEISLKRICAPKVGRVTVVWFNLTSSLIVKIGAARMSSRTYVLVVGVTVSHDHQLSSYNIPSPCLCTHSSRQHFISFIYKSLRFESR